MKRRLIRQEALDEFRHTYVSLAEGATLLGIHSAHLDILISKKALRFIRGRKHQLLLRREEINQLLPANSCSISEAAILLGVHHAHVARFVQMGKIPAVRPVSELAPYCRILYSNLLAYQQQRVTFYKQCLERLQQVPIFCEKEWFRLTELAALLEMDSKTTLRLKGLPPVLRQTYRKGTALFFRKKDIEKLVQELLEKAEKCVQRILDAQ
jgi:hypothetical protein